MTLLKAGSEVGAWREYNGIGSAAAAATPGDSFWQSQGFADAVAAEFTNHVGRAPAPSELLDWMNNRSPGGAEYRGVEIGPVGGGSVDGEGFGFVPSGVQIAPVYSDPVNAMSLDPVQQANARGTVNAYAPTGPGGAVGGTIGGQIGGKFGPLGQMIGTAVGTWAGNQIFGNQSTPTGPVGSDGGPPSLPSQGLTQGGGVMVGGQGGGGISMPDSPASAGGVVYQPGKGWVLRTTRNRPVAQTVDRKVTIDRYGHWQLKAPRMNPLNPQALSRAYRRMTSFAHIASTMLGHFGYNVSHKPKIKIGKKSRRRR